MNSGVRSLGESRAPTLYTQVSTNMADAIPHFDLSLDPKNFEDGAKEVIKRVRPGWDLQRLQFKLFTEGITNVLAGCYLPDDSEKDDLVLVRIFGAKTELIIDREAEKETFVLLSGAGCAPPLYCTFNNGMAYGFVKGCPLDEVMATDGEIRQLIAKEMAKLHSLRKRDQSEQSNSSPKPFILHKLKTFLDLVPEKFDDEEKQRKFTEGLKSKAAITEEFNSFVKHLEALSLKSETVFSHNDLLLQNIVYDKKQKKIGFIDYEYAFYNLQGFDIGNHYNEYAGMDIVLDYSKYPGRDYQLSWIRVYLEEYHKLTGRQEPTDKDVERLYVQVCKCSLASHMFWGLWALIQAEHSQIDFDYVGYGVTRFSEYFRRKDEFLSLEEP